MRKSEEAAYRDLVTARLDAWRRTAYLICRDWHRADDLVGQTIEKLYLRWRKLSDVRDIDAYVRGMLGRAWLDELRRPHRRHRGSEHQNQAPETSNVWPLRLFPSTC